MLKCDRCGGRTDSLCTVVGDSVSEFLCSECWSGEYVAICGYCGYQWDETTFSVFELDCPVCEANMVHRYHPEKELSDHDPYPWY